MEREGIFEGDYLIIERIDKINVRENDLLVTKYLPWTFAETLSDPTFTEDSTMNEYKGPVVKYCKILNEKINGTMQRVYQLGWRKDAHNSEYTIRASDIEPIGKVVGIHPAKSVN